MYIEQYYFFIYPKISKKILDDSKLTIKYYENEEFLKRFRISMKAEGTGYNGAGLPSSIRWQQMPVFMASIRLLNNEFALVTKLQTRIFP